MWGVRINIRQRIALASIFALVIFTIAVTIIRGSIFGGIYQSIDQNDLKAMNVSWIWFWFAVEFHVCMYPLLSAGLGPSQVLIPSLDVTRLTNFKAYIIACLVSYRALFTRKDKVLPNQKPMPRPASPSGQLEGAKGRRSRFISRVRLMQNSLLETCRTLEGTRSSDDYDLPFPPPGRMSINFLSYPAPNPQTVMPSISSASSGGCTDQASSLAPTQDSDTVARVV